MLRQFLTKRSFSAVSAATQHQRMEAVYQGYFTPENQRKIICIGRNYHAHIKELNNSVPSEPMWFDKPLTSLIDPSSQAINLQPGLHDNVQHELEMGVVIGMRGRNIKPENVMKHIAGYFVGLDFTNRALQQMNRDTGADWCMAKGSNEFAAVSEFIHKSAIKDPSNVEIELTVNGETRQKENTSMMIFDLPTMISDISRFQELREGDLLFTGTPEGVNLIKKGDHLICALRNGADDEK